MSFQELQANICGIISSSLDQASFSDVCLSLDPILGAYIFQNLDSPATVVGDGVTPLMVSCDKANESCLEYIAKKLKHNPLYVTLLGDPWAKTSTKLGENCAMHFAAMSGFSNAIKWLHEISKSLDTRNEERRFCCDTIINAHGDTCVMMACAGGHLVFIQHLFEKDRIHARNLCKLQNLAGDSALSLACGHGHVDIAEFLLLSTDGPKLTVSYQDIEKCNEKLLNAERALTKIAQSHSNSNRKFFEQKRNNVKRCLMMMQEVAARAAEATMVELITEVDSEISNTKKRSKATRRTKLTSVVTNHVEDIKSSTNTQKPIIVWNKESKSNDPSDQSIYLPRYRTLPSGAVVKHGCGPPIESDELYEHSVETTSQLPTKSVDDMLRERYRDPYVMQSQDARIDAVMDSLCLNATMLLLTSHGMAMGLSPSQLDAIESILGTQMGAVHEAKKIQARIRLEKS